MTDPRAKARRCATCGGTMAMLFDHIRNIVGLRCTACGGATYVES